MRRFKSKAASRNLLSGGALLFAAAVASVPALVPSPVYAQAAAVRYVVNDVAITSYDIDRRVALLQLMGRKGNLREIANQEMVDQTLRMQEIARLRVGATDDMVNQAYANFAQSNKMTTAQLDGVLSQSGVTREHFQNFMRAQMGWGRVLQSRSRSEATLSEQDVVAKMLEQGGRKPSATEYTLHQFIFVIPASERSRTLGTRKQQAQAMRSRFNGCENSHELAKGQLDVTVRDLGRFLAPQLPADWKDQIEKLRAGGATPVRETERGVEFIGVCSTREVSDDYVARLVFQSEQTVDTNAEKMSEELMAELREKARIVRR
jgi:peptidyl-prolyl cis-trans isomerase SurA